MSDNNQKHPYHLVDPSPWPLVTSFSALIMAIGFIFLMHDGKTLVFTIGSIAVVCLVSSGGEMSFQSQKVVDITTMLSKLDLDTA
jgi:hypothetical protein